MAELRIDIHAEAHLEEEEAFHWYRDRSHKAAEEFLQEIDDARRAILNTPLAWPEYFGGTRRYLLKRFPYVVVFRVATHRIEVIAIAHGRRKPRYWTSRLRNSL